jgi:hypothetical protein
MESYKATLREISERINTLIESTDKQKKESTGIYDRINTLIGSMDEQEKESTEHADTKPEVLALLNNGFFINISRNLVGDFWDGGKTRVSIEDIVTNTAARYSQDFARYFSPSTSNDENVRTAFESIVQSFGGEYTLSLFRRFKMFDELMERSKEKL